MEKWPTAQPQPDKKQVDKIGLEPGADKRLANILKKALNTPPKHAKEKAGKRGKGQRT